MVVVEVRQGTLGVDGRGWGPAPNNVDRGSQLDEEDEDDENEEEEEEEKDEEEEKRKEEEETTDIKSNNPHLAGGETPLTLWWFNGIWMGFYGGLMGSNGIYPAW